MRAFCLTFSLALLAGCVHDVTTQPVVPGREVVGRPHVIMAASAMVGFDIHRGRAEEVANATLERWFPRSPDGLNGFGRPVELVVPRGFTGMVWLVLDPKSQEIPLVNGRYQVVVPDGGVLKVRSFSPLEELHQFSARYKDGVPIAQDHGPGAGIPPGVVGVYSGGTMTTDRGGSKRSYIYYFVGTAGQKKERMYKEDPPVE